MNSLWYVGPNDAGERPGLTTNERAMLRELEREVNELRRAHGVLKSAAVNSTGQRNSAARLSAGVSKSRVLRGREFIRAAMTSRSSWLRPAMLTPLGRRG